MLRKYWKLDSPSDENLIVGSDRPILCMGVDSLAFCITRSSADMLLRRISSSSCTIAGRFLRCRYIFMFAPTPYFTTTHSHPRKKIYMVRKPTYQRIIIWLWLQVKSEDMSLNVVQGNACRRGSFLWVITSYNSCVKKKKKYVPPGLFITGWFQSYPRVSCCWQWVNMYKAHLQNMGK